MEYKKELKKQLSWSKTKDTSGNNYNTPGTNYNSSRKPNKITLNANLFGIVTDATLGDCLNKVHNLLSNIPNNGGPHTNGFNNLFAHHNISTTINKIIDIGNNITELNNKCNRLTSEIRSQQALQAPQLLAVYAKKIMRQVSYDKIAAFYPPQMSRKKFINTYQELAPLLAGGDGTCALRASAFCEETGFAMPTPKKNGPLLYSCKNQQGQPCHLFARLTDLFPHLTEIFGMPIELSSDNYQEQLAKYSGCSCIYISFKHGGGLDNSGNFFSGHIDVVANIGNNTHLQHRFYDKTYIYIIPRLELKNIAHLQQMLAQLKTSKQQLFTAINTEFAQLQTQLPAPLLLGNPMLAQQQLQTLQPAYINFFSQDNSSSIVPDINHNNTNSNTKTKLSNTLY